MNANCHPAIHIGAHIKSNFVIGRCCCCQFIYFWVYIYVQWTSSAGQTVYRNAYSLAFRFSSIKWLINLQKFYEINIYIENEQKMCKPPISVHANAQKKKYEKTYMLREAFLYIWIHGISILITYVPSAIRLWQKNVIPNGIYSHFFWLFCFCFCSLKMPIGELIYYETCMFTSKKINIRCSNNIEIWYLFSHHQHICSYYYQCDSSASFLYMLPSDSESTTCE